MGRWLDLPLRPAILRGFWPDSPSPFDPKAHSTMPFVHTYLPQSTSTSQRDAVVQGIHQALVQGIGMPEDELFNMVHPYAPGQFAFSRSFNGVDRKSTRLNSSHLVISYAVFCLKKAIDATQP